MMLTHLSLFSGIGGLDLAAEMAGFTTVGQCEWADYSTKVLEKHWPDVPRWRDIRTLTGGSFYERTGLQTVDVISGGFPCQPFSVAGKRRGKDDDRYLWPEMLRVISELRPTWIVGENVAGIVSMALDTVLSDLEGIGYTCQAIVIPACAVDASHRRDRVCILGWGQSELHTNVSDTKSTELQGIRETTREWRAKSGCSSRRSAQPGLGGVADGISPWLERGMSTPGCWTPEPEQVPRVTRKKKNRADRLKCLGNAVVPQQFYPIFQAIADVESRMGGRKMSRHKTDPIVMERVRQVIHDTGLSNKELSEALWLNYNTIGSWISGRTEISVEGIRRLCEYTRTNPAWVLGLSERREL